ncbi:MAG: AmmeMemoRadiSam system protein B [Planctomycetota bacterium]|jgi:AmmeMemoRadiSam system protein B|nr:AmmeMemoRadiSam system protein B [Planctomycetota bacterium]
MPNRPAVLAGSWYPGEAEELAAALDACLRQAERLYGSARPEGEPAAAVLPHAGLAYSGAVAAAVFNWLRRAGTEVETFVVFGACHRVNPGIPAIWARGAWETPLGSVRVDEKLADILIEAGVGRADERPHAGDNAIELQIPFIRRLFPEAGLVPVAMPFRPDAHRLGGLAAAAAGRRVIALASTDLTHYGAAFGLMPAGVGESALAWTRDNDRRFLEKLLEMDLAAIVPTAERDHSACGAGAAAAAAGWAGFRGCRAGRLLARTDSHEAAPGGRADHIVGYAALAYAVKAEV